MTDTIPPEARISLALRLVVIDKRLVSEITVWLGG